MIIWFVLFLLVIAISFVLAYRSMAAYYQIPQKGESSLFLIRNKNNLTDDLLSSIHQDILHSKMIISLERLFKGRESALVLFGPKKILLKYVDSLNLLELEDYTNINKEHTQAWEIGVKRGDNPLPNSLDLLQDEQIWWQLLLLANKNGFNSQIRAVVYAQDQSRLKKLTDIYFANILPKPFTVIASDYNATRYKKRRDVIASDYNATRYKKRRDVIASDYKQRLLNPTDASQISTNKEILRMVLLQS